MADVVARMVLTKYGRALGWARYRGAVLALAMFGIRRQGSSLNTWGVAGTIFLNVVVLGVGVQSVLVFVGGAAESSSLSCSLVHCCALVSFAPCYWSSSFFG